MLMNNKAPWFISVSECLSEIIIKDETCFNSCHGIHRAAGNQKPVITAASILSLNWQARQSMTFFYSGTLTAFPALGF